MARLVNFCFFNKSLSEEEKNVLAPDNTTDNHLDARKMAPNAKQGYKASEAEAASSDFSIFPNPAKTELNIIVEVQQAGSLSINIFDLAGKQVYEMQESEISKGHQLITLRNLKLSAGQYIVKVKAGDVTQSEQVVFE